MGIKIRNFFKSINNTRESEVQRGQMGTMERDRPRENASISPIEIDPGDPIIDYFLNAPGVVEIDKINLDSPALRSLRSAGVKLTVPLVNQGEVVGLLNLGSRLSEQEYSADDYRLLNNLATQASPALRVAQLVRQQQAEVQERERLEQELRVARIIQQTLLPKEVPALAGWQVAAYWQPARAVGGDFYDFMPLSDGRIGLVIGDVTDKGVPAALVMATTRSILRAQAERFTSPGPILERVNNLLCGDIPRNMFVTCQYMILDPVTGHMQYANAGHNLPYYRDAHGVTELRATGMPLGLMPDMTYEEKETFLAPGGCILFYSDGLVEAHNRDREMFSFQRLRDLMATHDGGTLLIDFLLEKLKEFTGPDWEQEDDVTFMMLYRDEDNNKGEQSPAEESGSSSQDPVWRTLAKFELPSDQGNERQAMARVAEAVRDLEIPVTRLERLKTAVAEATMNAIEHGNKFRSEIPVSVVVYASDRSVKITITDQGGGVPIPEAKNPDLDAKLAGLQSPRGWGLFLIKNMVDDMKVISDDTHHTVELVFNLEGVTHDGQAVGS